MQIATCLLFLLSSCIEEGNRFGVATEVAFDANGDGIREIWVGEPGLGWMRGERGKVWLVCPMTGKKQLEIEAPEPSRGFGWTLAPVSDVNGDGCDEVAVGAMYVIPEDGYPIPLMREPNWAPNGEGRVYLFSGGDGSLLQTWTGPADSLKLAWFSAGPGPTLAPVGDWNEDGAEDLAIGWCYATQCKPEQGCVRIVSTKDGEVLQEYWGAEAHDRLGFALTSLGPDKETGKRPFAASARPDYTSEPGDWHENLLKVRSDYVRAYSAKEGLLYEVYSPKECQTFGFSLQWIPPVEESPGQLCVSGSFTSEPRIHFLDARTGIKLGSLEAPSREEWTGETTKRDSYGEVLRESFATVVLPHVDHDGDEKRDVVVTVPESFCSHPAAILSSQSSAVLRSLEFENWKSGDITGFYTHVGISGAILDDLDKDGVPEIAIGGASIRAGASSNGTVVIYSGKTGEVIRNLLRSEL